jgi:hypothetical protein
MKKIEIILLAIMLNVAVGFAAPKIPKYTVIIDKQNGDEIATLHVDSGTVINQRQPTKDGFVFQSWDVDIDQPIVKDSVEITAIWLSVVEYQAKQDSILWTDKIQPKVKELVNDKVAKIQSTVDFLRNLVCVLAALVIGLLVFIIIDKKGRRDFIIKTVADDKNYGEGHRLQTIIDKAVNASKPIAVTPVSSYQSAKTNEADVTRMVDAYLGRQKAEEQRRQEQKAEQQRIIQQNQPKSFYADAIIDGKFNRVKETADENETIFELKLNLAIDTTAKVVVYQGAYRRILANPSFLEGCEKQLIGSNYTSVAMIKEGVAQKDSDGKWCITTTPEVKIS